MPLKRSTEVSNYILALPTFTEDRFCLKNKLASIPGKINSTDERNQNMNIFCCVCSYYTEESQTMYQLKPCVNQKKVFNCLCNCFILHKIR